MSKVFEEFTGTVEVDGVVFSYKGCNREWNLYKGTKPPTDSVWEIFVEDLPASWRRSSVSVLGESKEDAILRLKKHLGNIKFWYDMTPEQQAAYVKENVL